MSKKIKPVRNPGKKTDMKENAGKVFLNLGQVVFGTFFLGGVLRGEISHYIMIIAGIVGAGILILFGLFMSAKEIINREE
jgi:putative Mn2+ efflux pump MntP